jgi:hypothetical protein
VNYDDRVQETTTTAGTGTVSLGGAVAGYQAFSAAVVTGQQVPYCLVDVNNWEVGYGTLTTGSPWTLSRDMVMDGSSGTGVLITLSGGSTTVFNTYPADNADWPTVNPVVSAVESMIIPKGRQMIVQGNFSVLGTCLNYGQLVVIR